MSKKLLLLSSLIALNPLMACDNDWTLLSFMKNNAPTFVVAALGTWALIGIKKQHNKVTSELIQEIEKLKEANSKNQAAIKEQSQDLASETKKTGAFYAALGLKPEFSYNRIHDSIQCILPGIETTGILSSLATKIFVTSAIENTTNAKIDAFDKMIVQPNYATKNEVSEIATTMSKKFTTCARIFFDIENQLNTGKKEFTTLKSHFEKSQTDARKFKSQYNNFIAAQIQVAAVQNQYLSGIVTDGQKTANPKNAQKIVQAFEKELKNAAVPLD